MDEGIDTSAIIAQSTISLTKVDSFATYPLLQIVSAIPILKQAVGDALAAKLYETAPPLGQSKLWTHPTAWQYLSNRIKWGVR